MFYRLALNSARTQVLYVCIQCHPICYGLSPLCMVQYLTLGHACMMMSCLIGCRSGVLWFASLKSMRSEEAVVGVDVGGGETDVATTYVDTATLQTEQ